MNILTKKMSNKQVQEFFFYNIVVKIKENVKVTF